MLKECCGEFAANLYSWNVQLSDVWNVNLRATGVGVHRSSSSESSRSLTMAPRVAVSNEFLSDTAANSSEHEAF